jgi:hypothetical protein
MAVFWFVALCSLIQVYSRFRGACCVHYEVNEQATRAANEREGMQKEIRMALFKLLLWRLEVEEDN